MNVQPENFARKLIELYGGKDAASKALDKRYEDIRARWEQPLDLMGRIIRAHLFIEFYLTKYLQTVNPRLGSLDDARISFSQKINLMDHNDAKVAYLIGGIRRLNKIRNGIAHALEAKVSEADRHVFLSIDLFRVLRDALSVGPSSSEPIQVLEDFARHAGSVLEASSNPESDLWAKAMSALLYRDRDI